jgi:cell division protease FtsH
MGKYRSVQQRKFLLWLLVLALITYVMYAFWPVSLTIAMTIFSVAFQLFFGMLFMILEFAALFWFLARGRVYWIQPGETGFTWDDYRGNPEIVATARRIVTLLKGVKDFRAMGGEAVRGLLLVGPPGTGKSFMAQVIANEAGVPFCYASAPSFQNMFFGVGNLRVMGIYKTARKKAEEFGACVVFIDEIDAIGQSRSGGMAAGGMFGAGMGLLNELLLQMDPPNMDNGWWPKLLRSVGLRRKQAERPAVLTIGATNLPDVLDPALLRPGRFDRQIWVDSPDYDGRVDVFAYYLAKVKADPSLSARRAALDTVGYTPAQIKHVVNEAVVMAHQRGAKLVEYEDFRAALETYEWGLQQPLRSMSADERRSIAYHEAGHAVAQFLLQPNERVWKVTIVRRGSALGLAATKPLEERHLHSNDELLADIQVSLAARAAEERFLGKKLTGVYSDLQQATRVAALYLGLVGMGEELFSWADLRANMENLKALRPKINDLLQEQMGAVRQLVDENADFVHAIAAALLEREDVTGEEVEEIYRRVQEARLGSPPA